MQFFTLSVLLSSLLAVSLAAPAKEHALVPRQTYIITCIGGRCDDGSTPQPTAKPTSSKKPDPPKTTTTKPTPIKPSSKVPEQPTKTTTGEETGPSSTSCPVPLFYKCGGWDYDKPWSGCTVCVKGAKCVMQNEWYYQCVADDGS
ncbi:hypothetical protein HBH70_055510 [Parastagonospora nodorum]|nr:hypothetical protein HBH47_032610 [Parastagonospora nodorum]KAH4225966.1 hypothetical protein HBI06_113880 [Parastagonospora nodorum]KAH4247231.1 hypothetical protein HBI05_042560 [Parastagonospora nodorum]KAH4809873.1 hypothetical protein HBH61_105700 [Parastagonospora nodorum]KAH5029306.1 hypothetical protein HBI74_107030 [Parastagonospora nodorum]